MEAKSLALQIRELLEPIHGSRLKGVVLFGSVARGDQRSDSDIDVLVLLDQVRNYGRDLRANIEAIYPLTVQTGRRISAKPISERDYRTVDCPLYRNARREGIAAYTRPVSSGDGEGIGAMNALAIGAVNGYDRPC